MIKVSVLVPIYNVQKYLRQCLDSLCAQTLQEMEIICINDGSTDSCGEIIEEYAQKDPRIVVISKQNTGYGNSMNIGLEKAKGEYIGIVESDDFIEADMMECLYERAREQQLDVLKSNCFFYKSDKDGEENTYFNIFGELPVNTKLVPLEKPALFIKLQAIWSAIYSRDFLRDNNIQFNETPGASYQDVSFAFQVWACAKKAMLVPEAYYHYRTDNSNSSVKAPNKVFCICDELDKIDNFIMERNIDVNQLKWVASRLGYRVLLENYNNLASAFQYSLYLRLVEYFRKYKQDGLVYGEIWDEETIKGLEKVLNNPNVYFAETAKSFRDDRVMLKTKNVEVYTKAVLNEIVSASNIIIYGAGKIGAECKEYLLLQGVGCERIHFAVTELTEDVVRIVDNIEVKEINDYSNLKESAVVVVAMREQLQFSVIEKLEVLGFKNIYSIDQDVRNQIKNSMD